MPLLFFHHHHPHQFAPQSQVLQGMWKVYLCMSWYKDLVILVGVLFNFWWENAIISALHEKQKTKPAKQPIDIKGRIQPKPLTYVCDPMSAWGFRAHHVQIASSENLSCRRSPGQLSNFCWAHFTHMVTATHRHLNIGVLICKLNISEFCLYGKETMKTRTQGACLLRWAFPSHP